MTNCHCHALSRFLSQSIREKKIQIYVSSSRIALMPQIAIISQVFILFSYLNATNMPRSAHQQATGGQTGANFRQFGQTQRSSRELHLLSEYFTRLRDLVLRPMNECAVHIEHIGGYILGNGQCLITVCCFPLDSLHHK